MEVVRDRADNCIIICSIENVDPMGVHTGDSITVAPALTLTDKEYQIMRNASIAVLREIGVDTGGSNVQFAVNPADGRLVVIEMNPRVSRSSALASKATGFPDRQGRGQARRRLHARRARPTTSPRVTPASFEPTIDYVVTKMPRFTFEKFPGAEPLLTTSMKSVGEAMAIGRSFAESVQKALRSMETGLTGFDEIEIPGGDDPQHACAPRSRGRRPTACWSSPRRCASAWPSRRSRPSANTIPGSCARSSASSTPKQQVRANGLPQRRRRPAAAEEDGLLRRAPRRARGHRRRPRSRRCAAGSASRPVYKRIDTCAAEFASATPYMYSCYEGDGDYAGRVRGRAHATGARSSSSAAARTASARASSSTIAASTPPTR